MDIKVKGSKELASEVIDAGLCILCGACAGGCPYFTQYKGAMVLMDNCTLSEGQCYQYCPRTCTDMNEISQKIFNMPYSEDEIGTFQEVLIARSADTGIRERAQDGGTVTTILSAALDEKIIDGVVATRIDKDKTPQGFIARNKAELLECSGVSYGPSTVLEIYNHLPPDSIDRLGIVGLPCQVMALAKMKTHPPQNRVNIDNIKLTIGLFCTWNLSPVEFYKFLKANVDLSTVEKFNIPPPPANRFDVYTSSGKLSFPLEQVREFTIPGCAYCLDMTSEFADISVGSAEGIEGWNTVIVRTGTGAELMEATKGKGQIETDTLPPDNLAHLKEAALLKKKRALNNIIAKTDDNDNLLYLGLSKNIIDRLLA
ncbi:MAG: Coenzyme F420 hydrogenase/dehydrogenase, beta subunit C-terminal domain [Dehalococcoidales bacterium]|nr:MAG: Coenzyme F420 hydrogenase/dehydrogenase, beta subunit C-terminal domain [Dehalococcoidales bacterium]